MNQLLVKNSITINASAEDVWDALVNPEKTAQYMFGCKVNSDWQQGSPVLWKMLHEGQEIIPVKGNLLVYQPYSLLKYTVIEGNPSYPDIPENHLNVIYELEEQGEQTVLSVMQDGFETAADGERRYNDVYNNGDGWNPILTQIKGIVESAS